MERNPYANEDLKQFSTTAWVAQNISERYDSTPEQRWLENRIRDIWKYPRRTQTRYSWIHLQSCSRTISSNKELESQLNGTWTGRTVKQMAQDNIKHTWTNKNKPKVKHG